MDWFLKEFFTERADWMDSSSYIELGMSRKKNDKEFK